MHLTLSTEEARLLVHHLSCRVEHLDAELVHTDKRELQRALAREVLALRSLTDRIRASTSVGAEQLPDLD